MWRPSQLANEDDREVWCVYNETREQFLTISRVTSGFAKFASEMDAYLVCLALNATEPK